MVNLYPRREKYHRDDYYPCGRRSLLAYPKDGRVAVMGYVEAAE
jgi:hypothetical protein